MRWFKRGCRRRSPTDPAIPALGSYAPNTTRPTFANTIAPAHWAQGSSVTYRVQSSKRSVRSAPRAPWIASSSAWAVGSPLARVSLCARAMTAPSRIIAAPMGTSCNPAARCAWESASSIPARSRGERGGGPFPLPPSPFPALRTRRLGRRRRNPLEGEVRAILGAVHADLVALAVAPLQHGERQGVLEQAVDGALQRPGTVHRIVALGHKQLLRRGRHVERELAVGHELRDPGDLQVHDLRDVLVRQRTEHDDVVYPVQELGLERLAQQVQHLGLRLLPANG